MIKWIKPKDDSVVIPDNRVVRKMKESVAQAYGIFAPEIDTLVITSGNDGSHMRGSKHYEDAALDFRVWGLTDRQRWAITTYLNHKHRDHDFLDETNHIHGEYDPK